jgi:glycosyltransferase involved in cell wall biosynthesis
LWLIGNGSKAYQRSLARLARRLRVEPNVKFFGWVAPQEKHRLMAEAHALLMTSVREGWGLVVTEANACGTPALVYDVPGLRDSVRNEVTGLVVAPRPLSLANAMMRIASDTNLYSRLADEGRRWSRTFSLDEAGRLVAQALGEDSAA